MALTQIPIELSSTPGIVDNSNATAITIDSSENVLVGTTQNNPTSAGVNVAGQEFSTTGGVRSTVASNPAATFNRKTDDGTIALFRKDGSTVGSIAVASGNNLTIDGLVASHAGLEFGTGRITPRVAGATADNAVDLGYSTQRFQDLYLSGGAYLGGTGSANKLDDYEEGAFTLTISSASFTISSQTNTYTKIGNIVSVRGTIIFSAVLSNGSSVVFTGLPFNCTNNVHGIGVARETTSSGDIFTSQVSAGSTTFSLTSMDGIAVGSNQVFLANKSYDYQLTYQV